MEPGTQIYAWFHTWLEYTRAIILIPFTQFLCIVVDNEIRTALAFYIINYYSDITYTCIGVNI